MLVREGRAFTARAFAGNRAVAFSCTLLRVCTHPCAYLHLGYPEQFRRVTVRKAYRVPVHPEGTVTTATAGGSPRVASVRLIDLSVTGALPEAGGPFAQPGERVGPSARLPLESMEALPVAVFGTCAASPSQAPTMAAAAASVWSSRRSTPLRSWPCAPSSASRGSSSARPERGRYARPGRIVGRASGSVSG